jgi:hypothetical protein
MPVPEKTQPPAAGMSSECEEVSSSHNTIAPVKAA